MFTAACPSCGAEVRFRSAAAVMAVCEYCRSTLVKEANSVRDVGKMSDVLEDYSPIQINTSGTFLGRGFTVIGRIQLRFEAGFWNEWYVMFDDGQGGWLSDASGQYVFTVRHEDAATWAPAFARLAPGDTMPHDGFQFTVADARVAQCIAGQGELPFTVGKGWEARVVDLRRANRFLTLDYSHGATPVLYAGNAVTLEGMQCQLLRSNDDIAASAGHVKGKTEALDCPNCGGAIRYQAGMAVNVVCASCHADIDCSTDQALVLAKHEEIENVATTLPLGASGTIEGRKYSLIGVMKRAERGDESSEWVEYLLFEPNGRFLWLVESDEGWERVEVLNDWPVAQSAAAVTHRGASFSRLYEYGAEVVYAAGAFNWRVSIGDRTAITDYRAGERKLSAERSANELTWSAATRIPAQEVGKAFGVEVKPDAPRFDFDPHDSLVRKAAKFYSLLLAILNVPIAIGSGARGLIILIVGLAALWAPIFVASMYSGEQ